MKKQVLRASALIVGLVGASVGVAQAELPKQRVAPRPAPTYQPVNRQVVPRITTLTPSSGYAGDKVTAGTTLPDDHTTQYAEVTAGTVVKKSTLVFGPAAGTVHFAIPDVYAGLSPAQAIALSTQPMTVRFLHGTQKTNTMPLRVVPLVLQSASASSGRAGDVVHLAGELSASTSAILEYEPGKTVAIPLASIVPIHSTPMTYDATIHVPDVLTGKSLQETVMIIAYVGHLYLGHGNLRSNGVTFKILGPTSSSASQPSSPAGTSGGGSACAANRPGYTYRGKPECQLGTGGYLVQKDAACDYVCCASSIGANDPVCGAGKYQYVPDCRNYCSGGACPVQLMAGGCYQPN